MPKTSYVQKKVKQAREMKPDKQNFTAILCMNAAGSHKGKPFFVYKVAKPRCYRHLKERWQGGSRRPEREKECYIMDDRWGDSTPAHPKALQGRNSHIGVSSSLPTLPA